MRTAIHSPPFQIPFTAIFSTLSMAESSHAGIHYVKYWQTIPDNLSKAGWSWGRVSAIDFDGRTIWIADWHRGDGKGFGVYADEESTSLFGLDCAETWRRHFEWTPIAQATSTNWAFGKSSDLLIKLPQKWARPSTRIGPVSDGSVPANLRGLLPKETLVLIDGKRAAAAGGREFWGEVLP